VVDKFDKPFFFSEVGCPSAQLAANVPNDWNAVVTSAVDLPEQNSFFEEMFSQCEKLPWHYGYCIWDWPMNIRLNYSPAINSDYPVIGKPAGKTIKKFYLRG
jgi:hypothetical protein